MGAAGHGNLKWEVTENWQRGGHEPCASLREEDSGEMQVQRPEAEVCLACPRSNRRATSTRTGGSRRRGGQRGWRGRERAC